jgi:hypothetical protein
MFKKLKKERWWGTNLGNTRDKVVAGEGKKDQKKKERKKLQI